ncbi:MAG TPA: hypothetical protein PLV92_02970 [Pirellulaceae bacterium]|nr:hypothetical protein [Pirellulaceae bacterium]
MTAEAPPKRGSDEWNERMHRAGDCLRANNVAAIYLLHGTFVGDDAIGLMRLIGGLWPSAGETLRRCEKRIADAFVRDAGNYTASFAEQLERDLSPSSAETPPIPVRLLNWTSENHHVGRADGAVQLLDELTSRSFPAGSRVVVWGHSHGGNVLALLTNLLGADVETRQRFFTAARPLVTALLAPRRQVERWRRVEQLLAAPGNPLEHVALDFVTFGTPIRYGWETNGYSRLLHMTYHRPIEGLPPDRARFPFSLLSARRGKRGDYIQQVGISGTDFPTTWLHFAALVANHRLAKLLEPGLRRRGLFKRLRAGVRAADEGHVLLIDYFEAAKRLIHGALGHAIYTRQDWMLYHVEQMTKRWYERRTKESTAS